MGRRRFINQCGLWYFFNSIQFSSIFYLAKTYTMFIANKYLYGGYNKQLREKHVITKLHLCIINKQTVIYKLLQYLLSLKILNWIDMSAK